MQKDAQGLIKNGLRSVVDRPNDSNGLYIFGMSRTGRAVLHAAGGNSDEFCGVCIGLRVLGVGRCILGSYG